MLSRPVLLDRTSSIGFLGVKLELNLTVGNPFSPTTPHALVLKESVRLVLIPVI
jgi:hypothetical protein